MEIIIIVLNVLAILLLSALLYLNFKKRGYGSSDEIRRQISSSVNEMGSVIISGI
jgi:hypothetical protein